MRPNARFCSFSFLGDFLYFFFLLSVFNTREDQNDALESLSTSLRQSVPVLSLEQKETIEPDKKILFEEKKPGRRPPFVCNIRLSLSSITNPESEVSSGRWL